MTTVAALGFDDMPPHVFAAAYNLISTPGLVAFTIKEDFVAKRDLSGFSSLIHRMCDEKIVRPLAKERYRHRFSVQGEPLYYVAFVAERSATSPCLARLTDAPCISHTHDGRSTTRDGCGDHTVHRAGRRRRSAR